MIFKKKKEEFSPEENKKVLYLLTLIDYKVAELNNFNRNKVAELQEIYPVIRDLKG